MRFEADDHGPTPDVVDILTDDHQQMLELLTSIESTPDPARRRDLADTVIAEVMRHAVAEEMFVYPAVEQHMPNGKKEVEHDKKERDEIIDLMKQMEDLDASEPAFMERVRELEQLLTHHARDEEKEHFPKLRVYIPQEKLVDLARKAQNAKKVAPTRPHPRAPHSELLHKSVGPGVGMIDRLRDKLEGRMTD